MRQRYLRVGVLAAALVATTAAAVLPQPAQARPGRPITPVERSARAQLATSRHGGLAQPDPRVALLPDPSSVDLVAAARLQARKAAARLGARAIAAKLKPARPPAPYAEREPATAQGRNDTPATAERIDGFGTAGGANPRLAVHGTLAANPAAPTLPPAAEDNGAIPLAADTGLGTRYEMVRTSGVIGDGPHGSGGDAKGDFDFYKLAGLPADGRVSVTVNTAGGPLLPMLVLYDAAGGMLLFTAGNHIEFPVTAGDVYLMVGGLGGLPADPNDPASGPGAGFEGPYGLTLFTRDLSDVDTYSVDLRAGDVLGASVKGVAGHLAVYDPSGRLAVGSGADVSGAYAPQSPLPGGGNAVLDLVAPADGRYAIAVTDGTGLYDVTIEAYRPGTEQTARNTVQTIFLDFDGARVNTAIFGGPGVRDLSPLSTFLPRWGLTATDERKLISGIVASVKENVAQDLARSGGNPEFAVRILNSRDDADPFGKPNVTRLVVGGTIEESGIQTIGISQSIDPGNFGHEETALILLDLVSSQGGEPYSLNTYTGPTSDKIGFIGRVLGNIASHELGHMSGNWHVDQFNDVADLMDQGGNFPVMAGIGPDGIGGTADDVDVDFGTDTYNPREPFTGTENTKARMAWAYSRGRG